MGAVGVLGRVGAERVDEDVDIGDERAGSLRSEGRKLRGRAGDVLAFEVCAQRLFEEAREGPAL